MNNNDIIYTVVFAALAILLLIAGVIITIFIAHRQKTKQEIEMAQMQLSYEKEIRTVEQEVQEQVLANFSSELHDNIGQLLTLLRLQIEQEKLDSPEDGKFAGMDDTLEMTINQVRMMSRSLNSDFIMQAGLVKAIDIEINRLKQINSIQIHWDNDQQEPHLSKDQRLMAFRIFQEMLNNTLKHAKAKNIYITLKGDKQQFMLSVKDDGVGFDLSSVMNNGANGLKNIVKRAALAQLNCEIITQKGEGCQYVIKNF